MLTFHNKKLQLNTKKVVKLQAFDYVTISTSFYSNALNALLETKLVKFLTI